MTIDERLAKKGRSEPRAGLVEQGRASAGLARKFATELDASGWPATQTEALEAEITAVDSKAAAKSDAEGSKLGDARAEQNAIDEAKKVVRRFRNVVRTVLRATPSAGLTVADFHAGQPLARTTKKISAFLNDVGPKVKKLDEPLKKYFQGALASELFANAKAKLDAANTQQEVSLGSLPLETQKVYESKGRLLELIEELNGCGKNAFDGSATTAALFNKDILLRARRTARKPEEGGGGGGGGGI